MARSLDAVGPGLERLENNTVYIGKKPMMTYVLAVVSQFNVGSENVIIKARGKSISRAVDVAEIVRNRYVTQAQVRERATLDQVGPVRHRLDPGEREGVLVHIEHQDGALP